MKRTLIDKCSDCEYFFFLHEIGEVINCRNPVKTLVICRLYHCFQVPMYTGRIVCTDGLLVIVDAHAHLYECM